MPGLRCIYLISLFNALKSFISSYLISPEAGSDLRLKIWLCWGAFDHLLFSVVCFLYLWSCDLCYRGFNCILRTYVTRLSMMPVVVLSFNNNAIRVPCSSWYLWIDVYLAAEWCRKTWLLNGGLSISLALRVLLILEIVVYECFGEFTEAVSWNVFWETLKVALTWKLWYKMDHRFVGPTI